MRVVGLLLCLLLPVVARAQESYHDVVFQRDTGEAVIREDERLIHVSPEDVRTPLPAYPTSARMDLLLLSDGLWLRDGTRFAYFRPGPDGWSRGTWLTSRAFRASALENVWIQVEDNSPVLSSKRGRFDLRLEATDTAIVEHQAKDYEPSQTDWRAEVRWEEPRCIVTSWNARAEIELPPLVHAVDWPCPTVQTRSGRLWLESKFQLVAERGDGWWVLDKGEEPPPPLLLDAPKAVLSLSRAIAPLSLVAAGGLLTAGAFATPGDRGDALTRNVGAMLTSLPSLLAIERGSRASGAHDYSAFFLYPVALLLSPLPALSQAALGASLEDGATHRGRGTGAAFAATLGSAALITPLSYFLRARISSHHRHWPTVLEAALIGFATSVTYSYTAGLH